MRSAGTASTGTVRLQKILADAGVASRRAAEQLIVDGAVSVNGRVIKELGAKADPARDDIRVSGSQIGQPSPPVYIALHKPAGYITTASDEHGRATVLDLMKEVSVRVFPVGRLDRNSEGLLLLTNNGDLAARLTHPRYGIEKEYHVLVEPVPVEATLQRLRDGVVVERQRTAPAQVVKLAPEGAGAWLSFTIHEGRRRQIRLMCEAVGLTVTRLIRIRIGPVLLDTLQTGRHRLLSSKEVGQLLTAVGLAVMPPPPKIRPGQPHPQHARPKPGPSGEPAPPPASRERKRAPKPRRPPGPRPIEGNKRRNRNNRPPG